MSDSKLDALIRLRKWELDEKQKALGALFRQAEAVEGELTRLSEQLAAEGALVRDMPEVAHMTGSFAEGQMLRLEAMGMMRDQLEGQIAIAQSRLQEAFQAMRSVELADQDRKAKDQAKRDKAEQDSLDEVALEGWQRQQC